MPSSRDKGDKGGNSEKVICEMDPSRNTEGVELQPCGVDNKCFGIENCIFINFSEYSGFVRLVYLLDLICISFISIEELYLIVSTFAISFEPFYLRVLRLFK